MKPVAKMSRQEREAAYEALEMYWEWSTTFQALYYFGDSHASAANVREYTHRSGLACHWFASLYPVVEGWRALDLHDPNVDVFLSDREELRKLKVFRNAAFHYHGRIAHPKFLGLVDDDERLEWVLALSNVLYQFFVSRKTNRTLLDAWLQTP